MIQKSIDDISLVEMIDSDTLQMMQDTILKALDISAIITDEKGNAVTDWPKHSEYCNLIMSRNSLGGTVWQFIIVMQG